MVKRICVMLSAIILLSFSGCGVKNEASSNTEKNESVISALEKADIISEDDAFINHARDIGLFGPEGSYKYIYRKNDGTCYYVAISELKYEQNGKYSGYEYQAGETFYSVKIQNCKYNNEAEFIDERISEPYGVISYYLAVANGNEYRIINVNDQIST